MSQRELVIVGRGNEVLARRCAWCQRWFSTKDARAYIHGAQVTHGICESCAEKYAGQELPEPAA